MIKSKDQATIAMIIKILLLLGQSLYRPKTPSNYIRYSHNQRLIQQQKSSWKLRFAWPMLAWLWWRRDALATNNQIYQAYKISGRLCFPCIRFCLINIMTFFLPHNTHSQAMLWNSYLRNTPYQPGCGAMASIPFLNWCSINSQIH